MTFEVNDIFDSAIRSAEDLAGVFEYDGKTGYFYLYAVEGKNDHKVLDSIHIVSGDVDFNQSDISVKWNTTEERVGLFIRGMLWAIFDCLNNVKFGGNYGSNDSPIIAKDESFTLN